MKNILSILVLLCTLSFTFAQETKPNCSTPFIHVTGSSKMEITPNEIYIGFTAIEYKKGNKDILLEEIHHNIENVILSFGIPLSNLQVESFYGSRWISKRKIKDLVTNKKYTLKLQKIDLTDKLLDKLDSINIQEIVLEKITHSKIEEYREQVKINATKAALRKATLMTNALNQEIGKAIEVQEIDEVFNLYKQEVYNKRSYNSLSYMEADKPTTINFKTISLTYKVDVKFELL